MTMIELIEPNWPAPANVRAVSTLRAGGISLGVYNSLNLGSHVGDDITSVHANRATLMSHLNLAQQPVWLDQTHGVNILTLDDLQSLYRADCEDAFSADAAITRAQQRPCTVMTADCLPLLLTDKLGKQVAAVHAGWRGMADGIIEAVVREFDASADNLLAWCGPCIGAGAFEIGLEVRDQLDGPEGAYRPHKDDSKVYADLHALAKSRLFDVGVTDCYFAPHCTYSEPERFFSYRRDGQTGRMASLIWIQA